MPLELVETNLTEFPNAIFWHYKQIPLNRVYIAATQPSPIDGLRRISLCHVSGLDRSLLGDDPYEYYVNDKNEPVQIQYWDRRKIQKKHEVHKVWFKTCIVTDDDSFESVEAYMKVISTRFVLNTNTPLLESITKQINTCFFANSPKEIQFFTL